MIQTVTGAVNPAELGVTLVHEHVFIDMYEPTLNSAGVLLDESMAADELASLPRRRWRDDRRPDDARAPSRPAGASPRVARDVASGSSRAPASTGTASGRRGSSGCPRRSWPTASWPTSPRASATERIRAGIIGEVASGHREIDPVEARAFRAAARASARTGAADRDARDLHADRARPARHPRGGGRGPGPRRHRPRGHVRRTRRTTSRILRRGAWLAFDTIGPGGQGE